MVSQKPPRYSASPRAVVGLGRALGALTRTAQHCGLGQGAQGWSRRGDQPPNPASNTHGSTCGDTGPCTYRSAHTRWDTTCVPIHTHGYVQMCMGTPYACGHMHGAYTPLHAHTYTLLFHMHTHTEHLHTHSQPCTSSSCLVPLHSYWAAGAAGATGAAAAGD